MFYSVPLERVYFVQTEGSMVVEAIYEHGVLKLLEHQPLKEQARYRVVVEEIEPAMLQDNDIVVELERHKVTLPNGRQSFNLLGLFDRGDVGPSFEDIEATLDEFRETQMSEWNELYGPAQ